MPARLTGLAVVAGLVLVAPGAAVAAPAPCGGQPTLTDATGDGHHDNTDITAAWLTESAGRLQAVVQVRQGRWEPAHDDSDAAVFALLFDAGGQTRYVRAQAGRGGAVAYDHGRWSRSGGFETEGATSGTVEAGPNGTVTIDVGNRAAGERLTRVWALTWDGGSSPEFHWVDRGPGGVTPDGSDFGADYTVGACGGSGTPGGPQGPGTPGGPGLPGIQVGTTAVTLHAPTRLKGGGTTTVRGSVSPPRAGVPVAITATGRKTQARTATTGPDGSFSLRLPIEETTRLRAEAEGVGSPTVAVTVLSTVRFSVRSMKSGGGMVSGTVRPALPGTVLLLRADAVRPTARTTTRNGSFKVRVRRPGRYQAVFVPSGKRAERATSKSGVIR